MPERLPAALEMKHQRLSKYADHAAIEIETHQGEHLEPALVRHELVDAAEPIEAGKVALPLVGGNLADGVVPDEVAARNVVDGDRLVKPELGIEEGDGDLQLRLQTKHTKNA